jgi:hypothetical protein
VTEIATAPRQASRPPGVAARLASATVGWPLGVATICFTLTVARLPATADSYLDLVCGRFIVAHGIPHVDTISVAGQGRDWIDQQWLAQVVMYGLWKVVGHAGPGFLLALLLAAAYGLLTRLCILLGAPPQRAARWALLAFLGSVGYAAIRAEMFSYPAFVLTLIVLAHDVRRREFELPFLWVLAVLAVWANLHGGVVLGVALVAFYCGARAVSALLGGLPRSAFSYAGSAAAAVACLFATPYGLDEAHYYRGIFFNSVLRRYENEWTAPRLTYVLDWMTFVFVIAAALAVGLALYKRSRLNPVLLLATVVTGALAFHAIRYQPWFAISASALVVSALSRVRPAPPALDPRFLRLGASGLAAVALIVTVAAVRPHSNSREEALARGTLAAAAQWVSTHPQSRVLADERTSDRLMWWYPRTVGHVALDGRLDFYDSRSLQGWFSYIFAPGLKTSIGGTDYNVFVASTANRPLYVKLRDAACLRTLHADAYGIVAVRRTASAACAAPGR